MNTLPSGSLCKGFSWTAQTHQGRVRKNNEDAFLALMFDNEELVYLGKEGEAPFGTFDFIFAVSDGMGGTNAGEFASKIVLQTVTDLISREFHQKARHKHMENEQLLREFCQRIHEGTLKVSRYYEECKGMGATLSLCWFAGSNLHMAHLGDSRVYHIPHNEPLRQLSEDHTVVGQLRRAGKIDERQARVHPMKNRLQRSIGSTPEPVDPQIITVPFHPGDRVVLCSDGITDGIWDNSIQKYVISPPPYLKDVQPAQRLVREALDSSGRDNLTAIVIEVL